MTESTRPLPPLIPLSNGGWEVQSLMSSSDYTIRGLGLLPPNKVVPVIVVPGLMGTNLRARSMPRLSRKQDERNTLVKPGGPVWRPPNGMQDGLRYAARWNDRRPKDRQRLFDAATLEVDDGGPIVLPDADDGYVLGDTEVRQRGWGEVHADSYARLLHTLQTHLNQTFGYNDVLRTRFVNRHWKQVMALDTRQWGATAEPLTELQLEKQAGYYFPVYAVGYNWLEDCAVSAQRLEQRIAQIIAAWQKASRSCDKVILVTHSMGGFVARACARRIPDRIAGVIHGVMPALGTPAVYRRLACGTEDSCPGNGVVDDLVSAALARTLGNTTEKTTPVMATSPGILQLLPNHLHPQPWLHVRTRTRVGARAGGGNGKDPAADRGGAVMDCLHLPGGATPNPYELYRDMQSWYRMINPALADPAGKFSTDPEGIRRAIRKAIDTAETFHRSLGDYYHPNTYVFHGADPDKLSYGQVRWSATLQPGAATVVTPANVASAAPRGHGDGGHRRVLVEGKSTLDFGIEPQDAAGDGTVSSQSGAGPGGKVKQSFATRGYDHQNAFNDPHMLMLTLRVIAKIVQGLS